MSPPRWVVGALLVCALAWAPRVLPAQESPSTYTASVRLGMEYDDNAHRVETAHAKPDFLTRYFTAFDAVHPIHRNSAATLSLRHGGKIFLDERDADTMLTQLDLGYRHRLGDYLSMSVDADIKDRSERLSMRDYNRGGARLGTALGLGPVRLGLAGSWRYFAYKPNPMASTHGPQGHAFLRYFATENIAFDTGYTLARRHSDLPALLLEDDFVVLNDDAPRRRDLFHAFRVGTSLRWHLFIDLHYVYSTNKSNSYGNQLVRHGLELNLTAPLFWEMFLSFRGELQRTRYSDHVLVDDFFVLDEENRNAVIVAVARPIFDSWELEARYSLYLQEFGVGDPYSRQTFLFALGYLFD
ncbi:MAG: hypothetical protein ACNA8W_06420 [Bradymonadaceae bacterium]